MNKIWILVLVLISSPVLAQTQTVTADAQTNRKMAKEFALCSAYFTFVSLCFADKNRKDSAEDKKLAQKLDRGYDKLAQHATRIALTLMAAGAMSPTEFAVYADNSIKTVNDTFAGNCGNLRVPLDKYKGVCKRLVEKPLLRREAH